MQLENEQSPVSWKSVWQQELFNILNFYQSYRSEHRLFFLRLLAFFFLVNALCYWLAVVASFPELLDDLIRMLKIQVIVALLGGLFDSLSFFITIGLIRRASRARSGIKFIGILLVDLIIAAVATAWVLLVVLVATWIVGPPDISALEVSIDENAVVIEELAKVDEEKISTELSPQEIENLMEQIEQAEPIAAAVEEQEMVEAEEAQLSEEEVENIKNIEVELRTSFYQDVLVSAVKNPLENFRYLLFGMIMGASTLLPTLFHIFMAWRSLFLLRRNSAALVEPEA